MPACGRYMVSCMNEPNNPDQLRYPAYSQLPIFVGTNYFLKDRAGLKAYDPEGFALVEKLWGVLAPPPAPARAGGKK